MVRVVLYSVVVKSSRSGDGSCAGSGIVKVGEGDGMGSCDGVAAVVVAAMVVVGMTFVCMHSL